MSSELFDDFHVLNSDERQYRALFGTPPCVFCLLWAVKYPKLKPETLPRQFCWASLYLKHYTTEAFLATFLKVYCKTARKWTWIVIEALSRSFWVSTGHILFYILFHWFNYILIMFTV